MTTETARAAHVETLRQELRVAAEKFVAGIREVEPLADELADAEARLLAAECAAAVHEFGPPVRQLAAEVVTGLLHALQPNLRPITTREAAERAIEEMLSR